MAEYLVSLDMRSKKAKNKNIIKDKSGVTNSWRQYLNTIVFENKNKLPSGIE